MSKTFKDKPDKYRVSSEKRKPKEGRRFESSKGRKKDNNIKRNLEDYYNA